MSTYRQMAERQYYFELERRDRISMAFTGPVSAASLLTGAILLMFSTLPAIAADDSRSQDLLQLVHLGLTVALICIGASIVGLKRSWQDRLASASARKQHDLEYRSIYPTSIRHLAFDASNRAQQAGGTDQDAFARKLLEAEMTNLYIAISASNLVANETRTNDRAQMISLLVLAFVVLLCTLLPHVSVTLAYPPSMRIQTI